MRFCRPLSPCHHLTYPDSPFLGCDHIWKGSGDVGVKISIIGSQPSVPLLRFLFRFRFYSLITAGLPSLGAFGTSTEADLVGNGVKSRN